MLLLLSDQNFSGRILRGVLRRLPELDVVRALDVGLARAEDPILLDWAAAEERILLTHDVNTIPRFAYDRVCAGLAMPGVFLVDVHTGIGQAIDDLVLAIECGPPEEWKDTVTYFPLS